MIEKDARLVVKNQLFMGLSEKDALGLLDTLDVHAASFAKDELLVRLGEQVRGAGVVLEGTVAGEFYDEAGNVSMVSKFTTGQLFAEALAASGMDSIVVVRAVTVCRVAWIDLAALFREQAFGEDAEHRAALRAVAGNLVRMLSRKNVMLNTKMQILAQKRLRDRLRLYLATRGDAPTPTRTELARYLSVDRSALSREIGRMADEGVIELHGREIKVVDPSFLR